METISMIGATQNAIDSMEMNINMKKTIELMSKNYALEGEREAMQSMSLSNVLKESWTQ